MISKVLSGTEQSDFKHGCVQIMAHTEGESYALGIMFQQLVTAKVEVTHNQISQVTELPWIRIPLVKEQPE
jgi:hypothetical protein